MQVAYQSNCTTLLAMLLLKLSVTVQEHNVASYDPTNMPNSHLHYFRQ